MWWILYCLVAPPPSYYFGHSYIQSIEYFMYTVLFYNIIKFFKNITLYIILKNPPHHTGYKLVNIKKRIQQMVMNHRVRATMQICNANRLHVLPLTITKGENGKKTLSPFSLV
jgi:hypothetical protein